MAKRGDRIRRRADGRWEGRVKTGNYPNGKTKYRSVYGKTYKDVREKMEQSANGSIPKAGNSGTTFKDILFYWLKNSNINRKQATVHKYLYLIEKHISPAIGSVTEKNLSSELFNAFLASETQHGRLDGGGGLSPSYVKTMAIIIQSALDFCIREKQCTERMYTITMPVIQKKDMPVLSREDQAVLEKELYRNMDLVKLGVLLSLKTGMRIGEICALTWNDIDFQNDIIHIRHTLARVRKEQETGTCIILDIPKTEASIRDIPLPSMLRPYLIMKSAERVSDYVVSDHPGFISTRTYEYRYHRLLNHCGLPPINYHALRHTFATRCVEIGMDIKTLSEILGHADASITLKTYVHSSMENKRRGIEKLVSAAI